MPRYTAIMKLDPLDNRVAKYMPFKTKADADAHVAAFADSYPNAFVHKDADTVPVKDPGSWRFDAATNKILDRVRRFKSKREKGLVHKKANKEYVRRGLTLLGVDPRGSPPDMVLATTALKETYRNGPNAVSLAALHDRLMLLESVIDIANDRASLEVIDVTDNTHWSLE